MIFYFVVGAAVLFVILRAVLVRRFELWTVGVSIAVLLVYIFMAAMPLRSAPPEDVFPGKWRVTGTEDLVALNTGSDTRGQFFLGSGYVDSELVYMYLTTEDNGVVVPKEVDKYGVGIIETDERGPEVEHRYYVYEPFLVPWEITSRWGLHWFYVPDGTIVPSYNVNP